MTAVAGMTAKKHPFLHYCNMTIRMSTYITVT